MKKQLLVGSAAAAMVLGLASAPALAGRQSGTVVVTPDPVEVGGTALISNAEGLDSACQSPFVDAASPSEDVIVDLEVENPEGGLIIDEEVVPDTDGNWSYETPELVDVGEYTVIAVCESVIKPVMPAEEAPFRYEDAVFQVIAQEPTTTTTTASTTTSTTGSTTTTAATAAVAATPHYTG